MSSNTQEVIQVSLKNKTVLRSSRDKMNISQCPSDIEELGTSRLNLCRCQQSKNFPVCDGTHERFNRETNSNITPILIELIDKPKKQSTDITDNQKLITQNTKIQQAANETKIINEFKKPLPLQENLLKKVDKKKIREVFSEEEISKHCTENDCWMIINGHVYNITSYLPYHPGGRKALLKFAGKDGSENLQYHSAKMMHLLDNYFYIGRTDKLQESSCTIS